MSQSLEIHHINVAGGDCTVIALRADPTKKATTNKILIDGGCVGSGWKSLAGYLKKYFDDRPFDYMIASHYHDDHIMGLPKAGVKFKNYVDIGGYDMKNGVPFTPKRKPVATSSLGYYNSYAELVDGQVKENKAKRFNLPFLEMNNSTKGPVQIAIDTDITLTCYCGDGYLADGTDVIAAQNKGTHPSSVDENDLSLGFLLTWREFIYYTVADLSGDNTRKTYYNIEGPLVNYLMKGVLKGKSVTVAKSSHHGSNHSTYPQYDTTHSFLNLLQPDTIIVPCNIPKGVPGEFFLARAHEYSKKKKKMILFANDLAYTNTATQYVPLEKIISDKIESNLLIDEKNDKLLNNEGPTAVVVQVKSDASVSDLALGDKAEKFERTGYKIYIDKSELPDVKKVPLTAIGVKLRAFADEDGTILPSIQKGFQEQAKEITNWIENDLKQEKKPAQEWLGYYTPALNIPQIAAEVKTNKANAVNLVNQQFTDLFNEAYIKKPGDKIYSPNQTLGRFKKQTIQFLLVENPNQVRLNQGERWATKEEDFNYVMPVEEMEVESLKRKQVLITLQENPRQSKRHKKEV